MTMQFDRNLLSTPFIESGYTSINHDVDALLAQALNQMSFDEREAVYEEIHGVSKIVVETDDLITNSLRAMEEELDRIPSKKSYKIAEANAKEYVTSRKFRLMFLRAQRFDPKEAASHLVRYLEGKLELFGIDTLGRSVYLCDLDEDTLECLRAGSFQVLPKRDSAGRAILGNFLAITKEKCYKNSVSVVKCCAYVLMTMVEEDEETQRKGVVGIMYNTGGRPIDYDPEFNQLQSKLLNWLPWRIEAAHNCVDDANHITKKINGVLIAALSRYLQVRHRFHYGTHTECQYSLMTFGVPIDTLPVAYNGELKLSNNSKWIARRVAKETVQMKSGISFDGIDLPGEGDVLSGRGNTFQDHPGNVKMRCFVSHFVDVYKSMSTEERKTLTMRLVKDIHAYGGRFLKREKDGWWREVDDSEAERKVVLAIRTMIQAGKDYASDNNSKIRKECHGRSKRARIQAEEPAITCWNPFRPVQHDGFSFTQGMGAGR